MVDDKHWKKKENTEVVSMYNPSNSKKCLGRMGIYSVLA